MQFYYDFISTGKLSQKNYEQCKTKKIDLGFQEKKTDFVVASLLIQKIPKTENVIKNVNIVGKKNVNDVLHLCTNIFGKFYNLEKTNSAVLLSSKPSSSINDLMTSWGNLCYYYQSMLIEKTDLMKAITKENTQMKVSGTFLHMPETTSQLIECGFTYKSSKGYWKPHKYIQSPVKGLFLKIAQMNSVVNIGRGNRGSRTTTTTETEPPKKYDSLRLKNRKSKIRDPAEFDVFSEFIETIRTVSYSKATSSKEEDFLRKMFNALQELNTCRNATCAAFAETLEENGKSPHEIDEMIGLASYRELKFIRELKEGTTPEPMVSQMEAEYAHKKYYEKMTGREMDDDVLFTADMIERSASGHLERFKEIMTTNLDFFLQPHSVQEEVKRTVLYSNVMNMEIEWEKISKDRNSFLDYLHFMSDSELDMINTITEHSGDEDSKNGTQYLNMFNYNREIRKRIGPVFDEIVDTVFKLINNDPRFKGKRHLFVSVKSSDGKDDNKPEPDTEEEELENTRAGFWKVFIVFVAMLLFQQGHLFPILVGIQTLYNSWKTNPLDGTTTPVNDEVRVSKPDPLPMFRFSKQTMERLNQNATVEPVYNSETNRNYTTEVLEGLKKFASDRDIDNYLSYLEQELPEDNYAKTPNLHEPYNLTGANLSAQAVFTDFTNIHMTLDEIATKFNDTETITVIPNGGLTNYLSEDTLSAGIVEQHTTMKGLFNQWISTVDIKKFNGDWTDAFFTYLQNEGVYQNINDTQEKLDMLVNNFYELLQTIPPNVKQLIEPMVINMRDIVTEHNQRDTYGRTFQASMTLVKDMIQHSESEYAWHTDGAIKLISDIHNLPKEQVAKFKALESSFMKDFFKIKVDEVLLDIEKVAESQIDSSVVDSLLSEYLPKDAVTNMSKDIIKSIGGGIHAFARHVHNLTVVFAKTNSINPDSDEIATHRNRILNEQKAAMEKSYRDGWNEWAGKNEAYKALSETERVLGSDLCRGFITLVKVGVTPQKIAQAKDAFTVLMVNHHRKILERKQKLWKSTADAIKRFTTTFDENNFTAFFPRPPSGFKSTWDKLKDTLKDIGKTVLKLSELNHDREKLRNMQFIAQSTIDYTKTSYTEPLIEEDNRWSITRAFGNFFSCAKDTTCSVYTAFLEHLIDGLMASTTGGISAMSAYYGVSALLRSYWEAATGTASWGFSFVWWRVIHNLITGTALTLNYGLGWFFGETTDADRKVFIDRVRTKAKSALPKNTVTIVTAFVTTMEALIIRNTSPDNKGRWHRFFRNSDFLIRQISEGALFYFYLLLDASLIACIYNGSMEIMSPSRLITLELPLSLSIAGFDPASYSKIGMALDFIIPPVVTGIYAYLNYKYTINYAQYNSMVVDHNIDHKNNPDPVLKDSFNTQVFLGIKWGVFTSALPLAMVMKPLGMLADTRAIYYYLSMIFGVGPYYNDQGGVSSPWALLRNNRNVRAKVIKEAFFTMDPIKTNGELNRALRHFFSACTLIQNDAFFAFCIEHVMTQYEFINQGDENVEELLTQFAEDNNYDSTNLIEAKSLPEKLWKRLTDYFISNLRTNYPEARLGLWDESDPGNYLSTRFQKYKKLIDVNGLKSDSIEGYMQLDITTDIRYPTPAKKDGMRKWLFQILLTRCVTSGLKSKAHVWNAGVNIFCRVIFEDIFMNDYLSTMERRLLAANGAKSAMDYNLLRGANKYNQSKGLPLIPNDPNSVVPKDLMARYNMKNAPMISNWNPLLWAHDAVANNLPIIFSTNQQKDLPIIFRLKTEETLPPLFRDPSNFGLASTISFYVNEKGGEDITSPTFLMKLAEIIDVIGTRPKQLQRLLALLKILETNEQNGIMKAYIAQWDTGTESGLNQIQ